MTQNSIRERILQAVMEAIRPAAEGLGATLHRSPTVAISREQCPALVMFPERDAITNRANDRVTRELTIRLVALVRTVPPLVPETEADQLFTAAHQALMANGNFGGLALGIREEESEWEIEDADAVVAAIPCRYLITYRTFARDISIQG